MKIIHNFKKQYKNPVIVIGSFDGVHNAHREIILRAIRRAKKIKGVSVILTFEPHPLKILAPSKSPEILTTFSEKLQLLKKLAVNTIAVVNFDRGFSELSPDEFIKEILINKLKVKEIFVGSDFRFGKGKKGNINFLKEKSKIYNFKINKIEKILLDKKRISSSLIRKLIKEGKIKEAKKFLGYNYFLSGKVIKGKKRGKILSFPTANISVHPDKLLPKDGVYAGYTYLSEKKKLLSAINIGTAPTFDEKEKRVETYIIDFKGNLYGRNLKIEFTDRVREEKKFKNEKELIEQIKKDVKKIKVIIYPGGQAKSLPERR